ncbi:uncharacterized protein LOC129607845 isoform X2 [Condylostylus longicornis]|uniref:uncharacterized protein LOC129607845 isoform X2 n=1 Tax=Condylostylus longicornis TaxID=2530218 RepID=UPI00244DF7AE|nr:uncharacterized protein LOC129607845 isoform X2 [Condylostylus longicornis]
MSVEKFSKSNDFNFPRLRKYPDRAYQSTFCLNTPNLGASNNATKSNLTFSNIKEAPRKLHSEYRSTYRWHEFAANAKQEVVRRPPAPNQFSQINEPPLPRRKKCPELAYKTHEFIIGSEITKATGRARPEERGTPSRRSKSEGPHGVPNGRVFPISTMQETTDGIDHGVTTAQTGESSGIFKKTISKLSTEYRLQFVWPRRAIKGPNDPDQPKKSISMSAIKPSQSNVLPTVHKKRTPSRKEAAVHELEPLVNHVDEKKPSEKQVTIAEPKTTRPFSQLIDQERANHFITRKENFGFEDIKSKSFDENKNASPYNNEEWYKEVIELRKKAGEYKHRGWGIEIDPDLHKKQKDLWDQVSKRSSLSALSLASTVHRDVVDNRIIDEPILPARVQTIRHHLERTTGPDVEEGALLPSPTREKLMPAITKRESESQRGSPKKSVPSRHGSPQKGSPQKGSPKKTYKARSQSVGPGAAVEANESSPKRQLRSTSTAPSSAPPATKVSKKPGSAVPAPTTTTTERKPRPYDDAGHDAGVSVSSCSPQLAPEQIEHIVKSPPEPTRVKSPEQIIMRSPDPVNWTVPLDTGKTFTVTQNVKDGENISRPQSEIKASTPIDRALPAIHSAPPELTEQAKLDAWKNATEIKKDDFSGTTIFIQQNDSTPTTSASTIRTSIDGSISIVEPSELGHSQQQRTSTAITASDVLEKARDRFDRFWGSNNKEDSV